MHFFLFMRIEEVVSFLNNWAPPGIAWERDNVGLQAGSLSSEVTGILLSLDCTEAVLKEAVKRKCNLVISHHPLLFNPVKKIDTDSDDTSKILSLSLQNNITLLAYHTNLDFTTGGVNHVLASALGLQNQRFLEPSNAKQYKLTVFVPKENLDALTAALFAAGAGKIGEYSECSFTTAGTGTFRGSDKSNPAVGSKGVREHVAEIRLEVLVPAWALSRVTKALYTAHPYEEPAFDIYPLQNGPAGAGMGVIGTLPQPMSQNEFLTLVGEKINPYISYTEGKNNPVSTVAVCGGSGSELLNTAIRRGADCFITADIRYHAYHDAAGKILLINAGHYETEVLVLDEVKKRLNDFFRGAEAEIPVDVCSCSTNPVRYHYKTQEKSR